MTTEVTTQVETYFRRARLLYPSLGIQSETKRGKDVAFLRKFGLSPTIRHSWCATGIKKIYWEILELLEETERLKESKKI